MGMLVKKDNLGFGLRSWRYSALVDNKVIKKCGLSKALEKILREIVMVNPALRTL